MRGLIRELRRREVFRTAGLYVGIAWIAIEGASVLLPAFEAPDWILRALIIAAVVGFPVAIVLAWMLYNAAMKAKRDPAYFARYYESLTNRGIASTGALVAIARTLAQLAFVLLKTQTDFDPSKLRGARA